VTVVFVEPSPALPLVSVVVAFRSGSAHDPVGREGLARITGRMLRRGAEGWSSEAIERTIDLLGGELGVDVSQSASTVHFEVIRRSLEPVVELVSTLIARPSFDEGELGRLVREAEAELIEARDSDGSLCARAFRRTLFAGHPYGRRVAGNIPSLRAMGRSEVASFYETHYTRENAAVVISGDVDVEEGQVIAERLLANLPAGASVPDPVQPPPRRSGRRLVFVDKPERTQTQMIVGGLGTHPSDPDHMALLVANTAFGGTFTSRLMNEVRSKRGWSYGASSRVGFDRQRDAFTMWTAPKASDAAACLALKLELLHALRKDGITREELGFVKKYLVRSHAFEVDTARKRVYQKLESAIYDLPDGYHERQIEQIEGVSLEEANAAIRERLSEDDLVISVVGTHGQIGDAVAKAIPRLAAAQVDPFDLE
jgi:zinc protease